jgi:hypothetical protein
MGHAARDVFSVLVNVMPVSLKTAAEIVQSGLSILGADQPVFRAFSIAGEKKFALPALARKRSKFVHSESALLF